MTPKQSELCKGFRPIPLKHKKRDLLIRRLGRYADDGYAPCAVPFANCIPWVHRHTIERDYEVLK